MTMPVFHQLGHDCINLTLEKDLSSFSGMVCSPLNYSQEDTTIQVQNRPNPGFSTILDPQLYYPSSLRGSLSTWDYYPDDFGTADQSSITWWKKICDKLVETRVTGGISSICSPCIVPNRFSPKYYSFFTEIGDYLYGQSRKENLGFFQTAIIDFNLMKERDEPERVASLLSQSYGSTIYLIIKTDVEPRRELQDDDCILGTMKLIKYLSDSGMKIFIPFCSSDFLLWKYAGAESFATGKFFNLRRFTSSRFDEPSEGGGGQLPYWFERNVMAYLREGDLIRLKNEDLLHLSCMQNPFSSQILEKLNTEPGSPWLALSWRSYLYAFSMLDSDSASQDSIRKIIKDADDCWGDLENQDILMEERKNAGAWIRKWRIALNRFDRFFS